MKFFIKRTKKTEEKSDEKKSADNWQYMSSAASEISGVLVKYDLTIEEAAAMLKTVTENIEYQRFEAARNVPVYSVAIFMPPLEKLRSEGNLTP